MEALQGALRRPWGCPADTVRRPCLGLKKATTPEGIRLDVHALAGPRTGLNRASRWPQTGLQHAFRMTPHTCRTLLKLLRGLLRPS